MLERQLATNDWLAGSQPTIADIACYPYVALAPEGGVALAEFPAVLAWMQRIRELPGYVAMPGIGAD